MKQMPALLPFIQPDRFRSLQQRVCSDNIGFDERIGPLIERST